MMTLSSKLNDFSSEMTSMFLSPECPPHQLIAAWTKRVWLAGGSDNDNDNENDNDATRSSEAELGNDRAMPAAHITWMACPNCPSEK